MQIQWNVEVLEAGPQSVIVGMVKGLHPLHIRRHGREEHPAAETVLLDPRDILNRIVDVVQEELADPRTLNGLAPAEVGEPSIVRQDAGTTVFILFRLGRARKEDESRVERWHCVREHDFADDAVGELVSIPTIIVPVANAKVGVAEILPRVLVFSTPRVKIRQILRV